MMLPAGKYWVGDPCYAVPKEDWRPLLESTDYLGMENRHGVFLFKGHYIGSCATTHGDGEYFDKQGRSYPVDSGGLGAVHESYVGLEAAGGHWIHFPEPFSIRYEEKDGMVVIGHIRIATDDEYEEEEQW